MRVLLRDLSDILDEVLIVDNHNGMCRAVHALQEAVAAVVEAIEHVREVIVVIAGKPVTRGRGEYVASMLARENQCGVAFLQAKVLRARIEDLAVMLDFDDW